MSDVHARTLRLAAHIVGGVNELAVRLAVPGDDLALWLAARKPVPLDTFLRAVDLVVSHQLEQIGNEPTIEMPLARAADDERDEPTIEIKAPKKLDSGPGTQE